MAVDFLKTENQLPVNLPILPQTNATKSIYKKKQFVCGKIPYSRLNSKLSPIVTNKPFTAFHQNIRGLRNKTNELLDSVLPHLPHVVCLTEQHSKNQ